MCEGASKQIPPPRFEIPGSATGFDAPSHCISYAFVMRIENKMHIVVIAC